MKRFMAFVLAFTMIIGSVASAAPGDIIHTGNKKVYKDSDSQALVDAILDGADISKFYREMEDGKFVNMVMEEDEHFKYIEGLVKSEGITSPEELNAYLTSNKDEIDTKFKEITDKIAKTFDDIEDSGKGSLEDYFGDSKAPKLNNPDNYSTPVPGYANDTSKIVSLTLPKNASSWIYKVGEEEDFKDLEIDTMVEDSAKYNSGTDIKVEVGDYLLLGAVDSAGKLRAYASIEIVDAMVKKPRVELEKDSSIEVQLSPAENYSGATKVNITSDGTWKLAVLDNLPDNVYADSRFADSLDYIDDIELIVASDSELDNNLDGFEKYILVYSEENEIIEKYNIFEVGKDDVSKIKQAGELIVKNDDTTDYNYSLPIEGDSAGTTKIDELDLTNISGATKWMYTLVDSTDIVPKLDRVYEGSNPYEVNQNIRVQAGDYLMILATDNSGRVRAYGIVKIEAEMIRNPLAIELKESTHYTKPEKGQGLGNSKFGFLNYGGITNWKYVVSDTAIDIPELGSGLPTDSENIGITGNTSDSFSIESEDKLREDNFRKYMMVYGLNAKNEVQVYKDFIMNDSNVRMPQAMPLETPTNYSKPIKGNNPNTTRIEKLELTGLGDNLKFKYQVIDENITEIELNDRVQGTLYDLNPNRDISVSVGKHLLILAVDNANKVKAFTTIELSFENVKAGNADLLQPTTHYQGPVPGDLNSSTKFTFLNLPTGADKFIYKIADTSFGMPESGSVVEGDLLEQNENINNVAANKYLLLLAVKNEDNKDKVVAYREFRLTDNQVKGEAGIVLLEDAYKLLPGNDPSTTKLELQPLGLDNPSSIRWRYKLVDSIPDNDNEKPYFNQIVDGATVYNVNTATKLGPDINVIKKSDNDYGNILILATDGNGRTKAYAYTKITKDHVREHADEIGVSLGKGNLIDSVKFASLPALGTGNSYKYLISNSQPITPATGDSLPSGVIDYDKNINGEYDDITIHIGKHLSLYEVDSSNKIVKFSTFEVKEVNQGSAELSRLTLLEGNIVNGGSKLIITLNAATWNKDLISNKTIRDKLFNGFKADSETNQWTKVVAYMIAGGSSNIGLSDNNETLTIVLSETLDYNITEEQNISLTIPYEAIDNALNPIDATGTITIKPTIGATISGDIVSNIVRENDIKAGGKTIIIDLADGSWTLDLDAEAKKSLINGFTVVDPVNPNDIQWDKIKVALEANLDNIIRNSANRITITLPKVNDVDFGSTSEVISLKIPKTLIQNTDEDIVASPNFTIYPTIIQVEGKPIEDKNTITLEAPDYRVIVKDQDIWIIDVETGTLKDNITDKDLVFTGLPRGLTPNISKINDNQLQIKLTGTASATLAANTIVKVKIKGNAVEEPNSLDSNEIELNLIRGTSNMRDLENVKVNVADGMLMDGTLQLDNPQIEFSLDSTNGSNGNNWIVASSDNTKDIPFKAGRVYVRDANNHRVFYLIATLAHPKAPTGISVSEVDYDNNEVILAGFEANREYDVSLDGSNTWSENFNITDKISLPTSLDLRVRLSSTTDSIPSLATAKLNGLYLGDVKLEIGKGLITNTNTSMQYSLDSSNGIDGRWTTAKANETVVNFTAGNQVWIRQQTSKVNYRKLGEVKAQEEPNIETGVSYNILEPTITNDTDQDLEYKVSGGSWNKLGANSTVDKVEFMPGALEIRTAGTNDTLPSKSKVLVSIPNPIDPPELKGDDDKKLIHYLDENTNTWELISHEFEYDIGNTGNWQSGEEFNKDGSWDETIAVSVRKKATDKLLPSKERSISFTKNLTFENIIFDIKNKLILGTTDKMEYSINSTEEMNGIWNTAINGKTPIEPFEGMYIWLREKNKPSTVKIYVNRLGRQDIPDLKDVYYNVATRKIANDSTYNLEYRINNGEWIEIDANSRAYEVDFVPGKLEFRQRATNKVIESHLKLKATIGARKSGPNVVINDVKNTIEVNGFDNNSLIEYRINPTANSPWITGELLNTEDLSGNKEVEIRIKATNFVLSSQVTKVTFTKNLELDQVTLSTHINPHELNGTTDQMEYSINLNNGNSTGWILCENGNTKMPDWLADSMKPESSFHEIKIRDKNQVENEIIVYPKQP